MNSTKTKRFAQLAAVTTITSCLVGASVMPAVPAAAANESVEVWLTDLASNTKLVRQGDVRFGADGTTGSAPLSVVVDENIQYQQMDGFGASMTDASAWLLNYKLSAAKRAEVMEKLFGSTGIGLSMLRQTIGSSDFNWETYSYDDSATPDTSLSKFSIGRDLPYIVPMVKQALAKNPNIKVMASPWSPPGWMKKGQFADSTNPMHSGYLEPSYYQAYADYFKRFIQDYQAQGIPIYAVTPQNEPGLQLKEYATTYMSNTDQINFVKNNLGPTLRNAGLNTKIMGYDWNWDNQQAPKDLLTDGGSNSNLSGTAFHHYGGDPSAMTNIHNQFPTKDIWFTEGGYGEWNPSFSNMVREMIAVPRNWAKSYILWNIALDQNNGPTILPHSINWGMLKVRSDATDNVTYNDQYYAIGHFSKFVVPGAYRTASTSYGTGNIDHVAFKNPDGSKVLVAHNYGASSTGVKVVWGGQSYVYTINPGAVLTFKWNGVSGNTNSTYKLVNLNSGKALDVTGMGSADGTNVQVWSDTNGVAQKWQILSNGDGTVRLINPNSGGKALDVAGVGTADGTNVQIWTSTGGVAQKWKIVNNGDGTVKLINPNSGKALDVAGASTADGANVQIWTDNGSAAQKWTISYN